MQTASTSNYTGNFVFFRQILVVQKRIYFVGKIITLKNIIFCALCKYQSRSFFETQSYIMGEKKKGCFGHNFRVNFLFVVKTKKFDWLICQKAETMHYFIFIFFVGWGGALNNYVCITMYKATNYIYMSMTMFMKVIHCTEVAYYTPCFV